MGREKPSFANFLWQSLSAFTADRLPDPRARFTFTAVTCRDLGTKGQKIRYSWGIPILMYKLGASSKAVDLLFAEVTVKH